MMKRLNGAIGLAALLSMGLATPVSAQNDRAPKPAPETMMRCLAYNLTMFEIERQAGGFDPNRQNAIEGWTGLLRQEYSTEDRFIQAFQSYLETFVKEAAAVFDKGGDAALAFVDDHMVKCGPYETENFGPDGER